MKRVIISRFFESRKEKRTVFSFFYFRLGDGKVAITTTVSTHSVEFVFESTKHTNVSLFQVVTILPKSPRKKVFNV
jgi:hypothetical protein